MAKNINRLIEMDFQHVPPYPPLGQHGYGRAMGQGLNEWGGDIGYGRGCGEGDYAGEGNGFGESGILAQSGAGFNLGAGCNNGDGQG